VSAALAAALAAAPACGDPAPPEALPAHGDHVVVADSSAVYVVASADGRPLPGRYARLLGAVRFVKASRGLLRGSGQLRLDLARGSLGDSLQTRAFVTEVVGGGARAERRTAELRIRELYGKRFTSGLPVGGVTPVTARAQLVVLDRALSRDFEGEITRTPSGYRITTAAPILFTLEELGAADAAERWKAATGAAEVGPLVAVSVDVRLARRS
jgi:hypothetical protein